MKLYITPGSVYARMVRIVVAEKNLENRIDTVLARTREAESPYYAINPSGRVPYLLRDDGVGMEESALICAYLDGIDQSSTLGTPVEQDPWVGPRLEAIARSWMDCLSVWLREQSRPAGERSMTIIRHEKARSERLADAWEREIEAPLMWRSLHMVHITLGCALGLEARIPEFRWRAAHPKLEAWYASISERPSFRTTAPKP